MKKLILMLLMTFACAGSVQADPMTNCYARNRYLEEENARLEAVNKAFMSQIASILSYFVQAQGAYALGYEVQGRRATEKLYEFLDGLRAGYLDHE